MEHNDPSQPSRQYAPNPYAAQRAQQSTGQQAPGPYHNQAANDRYQQASYVQQSPTTPSSAGRAGSNGQQMYGFQQTVQYPAMPSVQSNAMSFTQTNQAQEAQRQQQQSPYQSYPANMYAMGPPPQPQQATASVYEPVAQYRQRPSAAETFGTQFGVPQSAQYFLAGQAGPTSAPTPEAAAHQLQPQYQVAGYPQPGQSVNQPYPNIMMDPAATYASYPQQPQQQQQQPQYPVQQPETQADQAFNAYNQNVRSIFLQARDGTLRNVGQQLLQISQYLLGNVEVLGLTRDEEGLHDERIRLWDNFNQAWLTTLRRQLEMTEELIQSSQPLREPQSLMTSRTLEQLAQELVRLCDSIEKFGLVDYQMGVAEEEILDLLMQCLRSLDPPSDRTG